jgi:hypothetical protein
VWGKFTVISEVVASVARAINALKMEAASTANVGKISAGLHVLTIQKTAIFGKYLGFLGTF